MATAETVAYDVLKHQQLRWNVPPTYFAHRDLREEQVQDTHLGSLSIGPPTTVGDRSSKFGTSSYRLVIGW